MKIEIQNTKECFVALWRELERTRQDFEREYRRFCIRRVLKTWMPDEATDDFIWEVCHRASYHRDEPAEGYEIMPPPEDDPLRCRAFLRALVAAKLDITTLHVNMKAMDEAYREVFPERTGNNVSTKGPAP